MVVTLSLSNQFMWHCLWLMDNYHKYCHPLFRREALSIVWWQALSLFIMLFTFGTALLPRQKQVSYLETFAKYTSLNFPKWKSNNCLDLSFIGIAFNWSTSLTWWTPTSLREKPTSNPSSCPSYRGRDNEEWSSPTKQPSQQKSVNGVSLNVQWHQGVSIRLAKTKLNL